MSAEDRAGTIAEERARIEATIAGRTLLTEFGDAAAGAGERPALHWREGDGWHALTWGEYRAQVRRVAYGLRSLGFGAGAFATILARNRPEHVIADLGILHARGVPVSLYTTSAPDQIAFVMSHCDAEIAIVEDRGFLEGVLAVRPSLPRLRHVILIEGEAPGTTSWSELLTRGDAEAARDPGWFEAALDEVGPDDLATLIYTSGTTGPPKGVMDTHRNVLWMAASRNQDQPDPEPEDCHLSYLPLAHAFERYSGHWNAIVRRTRLYFCPDPRLVLEYAREARPTTMIGPPRVWEKLRSGILGAIAADPDGARRAAVTSAVGVGRRLVEHQARGEAPPPELAAVAERAAPVWLGIRARVGLDRCRLGVTGAAPIAPDVVAFFRALDLPLVEGYGMSETTVGATINPLDAERIGTVGVRNPGVELRVAEDGELLVRGGNVMKGYYKDPDGTAAALDADGWLHTGDIASIDAAGYVRIVDRKRDLIITSGGKNVSPAHLENLVKRHPLVGHIAVVGDRRPYVAALIVPDAEAARAYTGRPDALAAEIQKAVDAANSRVSRAESIRRFRILGEDWTPETGELTPTLKMKRRAVAEKYASEIEALYADAR